MEIYGRAFIDGNDAVVVFPKKYLREFLSKFPHMELNGSLDAEPLVAHEFPLTRTVLKGMLPSEVLKRDGLKGYGNLKFLAAKVGEEERNMIESVLFAYKQDLFSSIGPEEYASMADEEEIRLFVRVFADILPEAKKEEVRIKMGAPTYLDALKLMDIPTLRGMTAAIIEEEKERAI